VLVLGFGLAITVAPLTSTVLAAVPTSHADMASAVNNDVARAASLFAVALLPAAAGITGGAYLHPDRFASGFHTAAFVAAVLCGAGALLAAVALRNPPRAAATAERPLRSCGLDAPPQAVRTGGR